MDLGDVFRLLAGGLIANEVCGQLDRLSKWLLERSMSKLWPHQRPLYEKTWQDHYRDCPGPLSRFRHAAGCWRVAGTWRLEMSSADYIGLRFLWGIGVWMKLHSRFMRRKALILGVLLKSFSNRRAHDRIEKSVDRVLTVADLLCEGGKLLIMGTKLSLYPHFYSENTQALDFLKATGFAGGFSVLRICANRLDDSAILRNSLGWRVRKRKVASMGKPFNELADQGVKLVGLLSQMHTIHEVLKEREQVK